MAGNTGFSAPTLQALLLSEWHAVGRHSAEALYQGHCQVHKAAQLLASAARGFRTPTPGDTHASLTWQPDTGLIATQPIPCPNGALLAVALWIPTLTLQVWQSDTLLATQPLDGLSFDDAAAWLKDALSEQGLDPKQFSNAQPYETGLPEKTGYPFHIPDNFVLPELHTYRKNAAVLLQRLQRYLKPVDGLYLWPHHFDLASLVALEAAADGEASKSVGIGQLPGDAGTPEPYLYINAWPAPGATAAELPALPTGAYWHTEGWFGAVLPASALLTKTTAEDQAHITAEFCVAVLQALQSLGYSALN